MIRGLAADNLIRTHTHTHACKHMSYGVNVLSLFACRQHDPLHELPIKVGRHELPHHQSPFSLPHPSQHRSECEPQQQSVTIITQNATV